MTSGSTVPLNRLPIHALTENTLLILILFLREQQEQVSFMKSGIATRNANFNHLIDQVERIALRFSAPTLLTEPTGAGKSFLIRQIYQLRQSRHLITGRFVEVNCATLHGDNAMSTLFGHVTLPDSVWIERTFNIIRRTIIWNLNS